MCRGQISIIFMNFFQFKYTLVRHIITCVNEESRIILPMKHRFNMLSRLYTSVYAIRYFGHDIRFYPDNYNAMQC